LVTRIIFFLIVYIIIGQYWQDEANNPVKRSVLFPYKNMKLAPLEIEQEILISAIGQSYSDSVQLNFTIWDK
jgi:hypothetical protein